MKKKTNSGVYDSFKMSRELRNLIHGYIMSDGYVSPGGALRVEQNDQQEKFVRWFYQKLESIRTSNPIDEQTRLDKRSGRTTHSFSFCTKRVLKGFHSMWYRPYFDSEGQTRYLKSLPKSIDCFFSPEFISVWFAGDGTKILGSKGAKFEVTRFTAEERQKLKRLFETHYDISPKINRAGKSKTGTQQWTLCINSPDYDKFKRLITHLDLIPTLFSYKLH